MALRAHIRTSFFAKTAQRAASTKKSLMLQARSAMIKNGILQQGTPSQNPVFNQPNQAADCYEEVSP
jgi:hypothetical protein